MELIDRDDLDSDPGKSWTTYSPTHVFDNPSSVVRFQHKYYGRCRGYIMAYRRLTDHPNPVPIALFLGFAFPPMMGNLWGDPKGAFIWAGLVSRLASMRVHFSSPAISDGRHISLALHFSGQLVSIQWA